MRVIDGQQLDQLSREAADRPRRRLNVNLHQGPEDAIQRMVIAFEPGTYVRPHRHPRQFELFVLLAGRATLLTFGDDGRVEQRVGLAGDGARLVEIPAGTWHSLVSHEAGTQVVEIKPGPYQPTGEADFAAWAPPEGHESAPACVEWLVRCAPGATFLP